jgi:transposase
MIVLTEAIRTVEEADERCRRLEAALEQAAARSTQATLIEALQGLRGVALVTATSVVAELGDPRRFTSPRHLMGYAGLGPREHSSGSSRRRGAISRSGNAHLRRFLVESAWHYRHPPRPSRALARRRDALPSAIQGIAAHAEQRLYRRFSRLAYRKPSQVAAVAVARELAGFIWAITRATNPDHDLQAEPPHPFLG